jgi:hypothetical protein
MISCGVSSSSVESSTVQILDNGALCQKSAVQNLDGQLIASASSVCEIVVFVLMSDGGVPTVR